MNLILPLLPVAWQPYAKSLLAALGAILVTLTVTLPSVPSWSTVGVAVLTALGVYAQPNVPPPVA